MMYGFVSNDDYSAGLWSNAQIGVGIGEQDFLRVYAQSTQTDNGVAVGLGSMPWFIQKTLHIQMRKSRTTPTCQSCNCGR